MRPRKRKLSRAAYTEPGFFELDRALFRSSYVPIAHERELDRPGAFATAEIFGDRAVCVRGEDGALHAFLDGCVHRGTPLFEARSGRLDPVGVTCPYHGLRFRLDGGADRASCPWLPLEEGARLRDVRFESRFGFVFVCLDLSAPPFLDWAGEIPPWLERASLHDLTLASRAEHEVRANWKVLVENFQESQHFATVHPSLEARTPWRASSSHDFRGAFMGGSMPLAEGFQTVSDAAREAGTEGRAPIAAPEDRHLVRDALMFPGWLTSLQPDYFLSYRLEPLAPDRTRVVADVYRSAAGSEPREVAIPSSLATFWQRTNAEDRAICERQQRGLAAFDLEPLPLAEVEDGIASFHARVLDRYEPAAEAEVDRPSPAPIHGIFGRPYANLEHLVAPADLEAMDRELTRGLLDVETSFTGGTLKWMGVTAPWIADDGYPDAMHVIESLDDEAWLELVSLGDEPDLELADRSRHRFGDETDHPLTKRQMRWLSLRHGAYFPWKVCYHLLENITWDDKHSGRGKSFTEEARRVFPRTIEIIRSLPFTEIGRVVVFGMEANDHAPLHRDSEPGKALRVAQSISIDPRGDKRFYLCNAEGDEPVVVHERVYWFNDMDYHGVLADPYFRYSIRVDGTFRPTFLRDLERRIRC